MFISTVSSFCLVTSLVFLFGGDNLTDAVLWTGAMALVAFKTVIFFLDQVCMSCGSLIYSRFSSLLAEVTYKSIWWTPNFSIPRCWCVLHCIIVMSFSHVYLVKVTRSSWYLLYNWPNKFFLHHKYSMKGFYKDFSLYRSFVDIL